MKRIMLKSKVHNARVTGVNLDYEGSLTLDTALMEAAELLPYEQVHVYNKSNGARFITYLIKGDPGVVEVNGAAAHLAKVGDTLIIAAYAEMEDEEIDFWIPQIIIVDEDNKIKVKSI